MVIRNMIRPYSRVRGARSAFLCSSVEIAVNRRSPGAKKSELSHCRVVDFYLLHLEGVMKNRIKAASAIALWNVLISHALPCGICAARANQTLYQVQPTGPRARRRPLPGEPEFRKWQLRVEARRETHDLTGGILDAAAIFSHKTKKMRYEANSFTL